MKNLVGKSDFLRGLAPGESAVWFPKEGENPEQVMRLFTATACRLAVKISQRSAMVVLLDSVPVQCVIVTKAK